MSKSVEDLITELVYQIVEEGKTVTLTTEEIQAIQRKYDAKYFNFGSQFAEIRHIALHMGKLLGRLSEYCEQGEHNPIGLDDGQIRNKVIPDLIVYSAKLSNLLNDDMTRAYLFRLHNNLTDKHSQAK